MAKKAVSGVLKTIVLLVILLPVCILYLNWGAKRAFESKYGSLLEQTAKTKGLEFSNGLTPQIKLATQMANTVSIVEYMLDPMDREKKSRALSEFSAYMNTLSGKNVFWVNDEDHDFYQDCKFAYHVDVSKPENDWYQKTMYQTMVFNFNINYNPDLNSTNLWLNVVVRNHNTPIGICGTAIPLDALTTQMYKDLEGTGIQMMFYNQDLEITTAQDSSLVENKVKISDLFTEVPQKALLTNNSIDRYSSSHGIYVLYPLREIGWNLVVFKPYGAMDLLLSTGTSLLTLIIVAFIIATIILVSRALRPLKNMRQAIQSMAAGDADLSRRMNAPKAGTMKLIVDMVVGFNQFLSNLQELVDSVKGSNQELVASRNKLNSGIQNTSEATEKIVSSVDQFSQAIENQSASVSEASGAVNQISANIESLSRMIATQAQSVDTASSAVEEMVGNIDSVNKSVDYLAQSFDKLESESTAGIAIQEKVNSRIIEIEKQSKMLQEANKVISSIASQTNLLAMNAAIEAAHAGDAGRGFSVVADEIRKLSETSAGQSKTIGLQLKQIQQSITGIVNDSIKSRETYVGVTDKIGQTSTLVQQISAAMEEQEEGSKQIVQALSTLNDATAEVRTSSTEMAAGSQTILDQMRNLQEATAVMREGMNEISSDTGEIQNNQTQLNTYSNEMNDSIDSIGERLSQFK